MMAFTRRQMPVEIREDHRADPEGTSRRRRDHVDNDGDRLDDVLHSGFQASLLDRVVVKTRSNAHETTRRPSANRSRIRTV